jgi:hypothetical protein
VEEWVFMLSSRRSLLAVLSGMAGAIAASPWLSGVAQNPPSPMPSPNAPANQNIPAGMDSPDLIKQNKPLVNPLNQEQIAASVEQLYKLAGELKDEAEHTDLRSTFPLTFVKKAQQIEKLAKQIKDRAKG